MEASKRRVIFSGRVIEVAVESAELPNGQTAQMEVVKHPGGAAAVAINERAEVCLLHHYRYVTGGWITEIPAGLIDEGEAPLQTARRELEEEAGLVARSWESLGWVWSSPGIFTEQVHLYLARELTEVGHARHADEVMQEQWVPLEQAVTQALDGTLVDSKTVIALLRAAALLDQR